MANGESEKLVEAVTDRVRAALAEAERRAEEITDEATRRAEAIVAEAEGRAKEIEADADARAAKTVALSEDQARDRIERARKALDELGVVLGSQPPASDPEGPSEDLEPGSDPEGRSEAPQSEGSDPLEPEPEPPDPDPEPTAKPSTEELIAQLKGAEGAEESAGGGGGDEAAARLVAMNMALDGASREDVAKRMADEFGLSDPDALLDSVFERAGR